jgi:hypothetical protein
VSRATERRLAKLEDADLERLRVRLRQALNAYTVCLSTGEADDEAANRITDLTGGALSRLIRRGRLPLPPVSLNHLLWDALEPREISACDAYMLRATRVLRDWLWGPYTEEDAARDYHQAQAARTAREIAAVLTPWRQGTGEP